MLTTAVTSTINKRSAYDRDAEWPPLASRHLSKPADPMLKRAEQVVYVCFPVALPGEDGRVIPFGKYHLAVRRQGIPQTTWPHQAMLVNRDDGACIVLSGRQLNALSRDPDVEIY
jgi:hypothetical protein